MTIAILAPLLLAAGTADVSTLDCPKILASDDYTDETDLCITAPVAGPLYEESMTCIGRFQGLRAMEIRLTEFVSDERKDDWRLQISGNDRLAAQIENLLKLAKADPDLDPVAGQAAYDAARRPLDDASTLGAGEQLKMWQKDPRISDRCLDVLNFFDANLSTRAAEQPRDDEE